MLYRHGWRLRYCCAVQSEALKRTVTQTLLRFSCPKELIPLTTLTEAHRVTTADRHIFPFCPQDGRPLSVRIRNVGKIWTGLGWFMEA